MTPNERARECVAPVGGEYRKEYFPVDIEARIAEAIADAEAEAVERAARVADAHFHAAHCCMEGQGEPEFSRLEAMASQSWAIAKAIRALTPAKEGT